MRPTIISRPWLRSRAAPRLLAVVSLGALVVAAAAVVSCSRNAGLIMSVDSTMATPEIIDEVGITLMTSDGNVFFSNTVDLRVGGRLPPLDLGVAPSAGPIRAIAVGFRAGAPKVFREAIGTAPDTALQLLQIGLDWENWGSATLEAIPGVSTSADSLRLLAESAQGRTRVYFRGRWVRSSCAAGMTPLGGTCASALESNLAEYSEDLERGGSGRRCYDTDACMAGGYTLVQPVAVGKSCTVQPSPELRKWVTDSAENFNVAVEGEAAAGVMRLMASTKSRDKTRLDGWWFDIESGKLSLPLTFCTPDPTWTMPVVGTASTATTYDWAWTGPKRVLLSSRCAAKTRAVPVCQKGTSLKPTDVKPNQGAIPVVLSAVKDVSQVVADAATDTFLGIDAAATTTRVGVLASVAQKVTGTANTRYFASGFLHALDSAGLLSSGSSTTLHNYEDNGSNPPMQGRVQATGPFFLTSAEGSTFSVLNVDTSVARDCFIQGLVSAQVLPSGAIYGLYDQTRNGPTTGPTWRLAQFDTNTEGRCVRSDAQGEQFFEPKEPPLAGLVLVPAALQTLGFASKTLVHTNVGADHTLPDGNSLVHAAYSPDGAWIDVVAVENETDAATRKFSYWPMRSDAPANTVDKAVSLAVQGPPMAAIYNGQDSNLHSAPNMIAALGDKVYFVEANASGPRLVRLSRDLTAVESFELRGVALTSGSIAALADSTGAIRVYFAAVAADKKSFEVSHVVLPK